MIFTTVSVNELIKLRENLHIDVLKTYSELNRVNFGKYKKFYNRYKQHLKQINILISDYKNGLNLVEILLNFYQMCDIEICAKIASIENI